MAFAVVQIALFCLGLALGSFLHVLASRYDPKRFLLNRRTLGGRSRCPHCKKTLRWYELVPLVSFLIQGGRCRRCGAQIDWSYFWTELASGLVLAFTPFYVLAPGVLADGLASGAGAWAGTGLLLAALWTLAFLALLLMTLIDLRLQIIPDELVILLVFVGFGVTAMSGLWLAHLGAAAGAALFFGALIVLTRGKGMGMGDAKLAFALGLLFGWPGTLLLIMLAFVIGAAVGLALVARGAKNLKSTVPFGPFLALAAAAVFFFGPVILQSWYNLIV